MEEVWDSVNASRSRAVRGRGASVCALVLENGGDEDQAIAALLHDAMEDQGGPPAVQSANH
jgi:(p)ppGpp synthase/HD superfamily hydrolase